MGAIAMPVARTCLCCLFLLIATCLATADPPAAKDKDKEPEKEKAPPVRIVQKGQAVGTVNNWNESDGKFTLHMKVKYLEPNAQAQQNYARELQNLMVRQQNLATIRNPVQRQQEMMRILQDSQRIQGQNLFTVKERDQDIEVELADDAVVRLASPPAQFDEKGNAKKLTAEELKEAKGPDNLPGYTAERDALRSGQTVMVVIGSKIGGPKKPDDKKDVDKKPDDEKKDPADKKKAAGPMPTKIIMVVILAEPKN
jgi:hypothetical protein